MDFYSYLLIWVCIFGLCFGSFYNVVILRSLSGESIVSPPSKCPKCGHKLYWWHNIPVISYILLRGKCYFCKEKISVQYPTIELLTMFLFGFTFLKFGLNLTTLFFIFWLSCLLIMTVTDLKQKLVDCNLAIAMAISGLLFSFLNGNVYAIIPSVLGLLAGAAIIELIARSGFLFTKTRAMGEADTYVAGALGAIFGIYSIGKVLLISLLASMIFIIPVFLYNKYKADDKPTCIMTILFVLSLVVYYTKWQNYWTLALLAITGLLLAYFIIKGLKKGEKGNYLPYVPALAAAAAYHIFFII